MSNEIRIWNRMALIYNPIMKRNVAYNKIINNISNLIKPSDDVLEIATGTGIISLGLASRLNYIKAIDFSPKMIRNAKANAEKAGVTNVEFKAQNAYNLQFESNSFDYVIMSNALHIMPKPENALLQIKRVLRPSGKLIAPTFMHGENKKESVFLSKITTAVTGFRVYNKWTEHSFCSFLQDNNFSIIESNLIKTSVPIGYVVAEQS
jgi:ubiquinone/menaquinone biosynthesis C-methylase UbiE